MRRDAMLEQLVRILEGQTQVEGSTPTAIEGVHVYRASRPSAIRCMVYQACVIIVAQGCKRARVGGEDFDYNPARFLVLPVSLPIGAQVVEASPRAPFLSFALQVDPVVLGELVSTIDPRAPSPRTAPRGIAVSETTDALLDAALRLLSCLGSEMDCRVLAPAIKREILYRVLMGPQGVLLQGVARRDSRLSQVARALSLVHAQYDRRIEVTELAQAAHMSPSTFYEAFKAVTSQSPLQYLKEVRLSRARDLIVWEGASAKRAASQVGYGSPSQFSREFKRRFGRTPSEERAWVAQTGESTA